MTQALAVDRVNHRLPLPYFSDTFKHATGPFVVLQYVGVVCSRIWSRRCNFCCLQEYRDGCY